MSVEFVKPEWIPMKNHAELNERWVQEHIAKDPSLLGLGDLILKDKERIHPHAGRLDLLLQDADSNRRFEVEIQLGKTDESHVIRTIEYWDIERKRYPQYDHTAVIVAEDITSRFLNVISLFNGFIPIIAIQMKALKVGAQRSLIFTKVLDETRLAAEDDEVVETTDRAFWEKRASSSTIAIADQLLEMVKSLDPKLGLKYNKFYIGLAKDGQPSNFVIFRPKKDWLRLEPRLDKSEEIEELLGKSGLDIMDYDARWGRYRIRLSKGDLKQHEVILRDLLKRAYDESQR